jgi:hypothetical protein
MFVVERALIIFSRSRGPMSFKYVSLHDVRYLILTKLHAIQIWVSILEECPYNTHILQLTCGANGFLNAEFVIDKAGLFNLDV